MDLKLSLDSDFIWPFLRPYMGVIPNSKMAFIFPISYILALIFPILIKYFPKCEGKGSFLKSQIKSLLEVLQSHYSSLLNYPFVSDAQIWPTLFILLFQTEPRET